MTARIISSLNLLYFPALRSAMSSSSCCLLYVNCATQAIAWSQHPTPAVAITVSPSILWALLSIFGSVLPRKTNPSSFFLLMHSTNGYSLQTGPGSVPGAGDTMMHKNPPPPRVYVLVGGTVSTMTRTKEKSAPKRGAGDIGMWVG